MQVSPGSQVLLDNAERYGLYLARSLNDTNPAQLLSRKNIGMVYWESLNSRHLYDGLFFTFPLYYAVISAKQFGDTNMDVSSLENEVFPTETNLINFTQQVRPAQISIPPQVLMSRNGSDGEAEP